MAGDRAGLSCSGVSPHRHRQDLCRVPLGHQSACNRSPVSWKSSDPVRLAPEGAEQRYSTQPALSAAGAYRCVPTGGPFAAPDTCSHAQRRHLVHRAPEDGASSPRDPHHHPGKLQPDPLLAQRPPDARRGCRRDPRRDPRRRSHETGDASCDRGGPPGEAGRRVPENRPVGDREAAVRRG